VTPFFPPVLFGLGDLVPGFPLLGLGDLLPGPSLLGLGDLLLGPPLLGLGDLVPPFEGCGVIIIATVVGVCVLGALDPLLPYPSTFVGPVLLGPFDSGALLS